MNTKNDLDIEPLLIWDGDNRPDDVIWVHPYIQTWFSVGEDGYDQDMHIVRYSSGDNTISIAVKSDWIDSRYEKYFKKKDNHLDDKQDVFGKEYVDTDKVFRRLFEILMGDTGFMPLPHKDTALEIKTVNLLYRMSKVGKLVADRLKVCDSALFTSDCGFHYNDETDEWGYDT